MSRSCLRIALTLCLLVAARTSFAAVTPLPDSTTVDRWTLPNGLEVVVRDVPGAGVISVTWGYHVGLNSDPADQAGWISLLAEMAFTGPAGGMPERTRDEMASLRPQGWSLRVNRRQTLFTETATPARFPGVLRQIALRMRGVTVTPENLRNSLATVRAALRDRATGVSEAALYWQLREVARGTRPERLEELAAAKALERVKPDSVERALARVFAPANGVLALVGDFSGLDLHAIVAAEFGALPGGARLPEVPVPHLDSIAVVIERPGLARPFAVVGLLAPALPDSMHPEFYMAMLMVGAQAKLMWGRPDPPLETRFQYTMLDDPGLVRFYPPARREDLADPGRACARVDTLFSEMLETTIPTMNYLDLYENVVWLLGGPLTPQLAGTMRRDPAALNVLSTSTASRALWGNEDFWAEYRRRFGARTPVSLGQWARWLRDPRLRVSLTVLPEH